ncbi:MAG: AAA family ATPase [Bacteroidetes bacterium]|nr:AAA family ATPase [Bacteroidota bacterium]
MTIESFGLRNLPDSEAFPFNLPLIKNLETVKLKNNITFLVGENGAGKSTLLEALAYATNIPVAGGMAIADDPLMQAARELGKMLSVRYTQKSNSGFFSRAEDFIGFVKNIQQKIAGLSQEIQEIEDNWTGGDLNLATKYIKAERQALIDRYGEDLDAMSHGEGFLKFFLGRITGKGLYIMDEPEAALSPQRQLSLISLIMQKVKENDSQFIIASHSPIIMAIPGAQILNIEEGKITEISWRETAHYQITRQFLDNPEVYLREL